MNVSVKELNSLDPPVPAFELIWTRMVRDFAWRTRDVVTYNAAGHNMDMLRHIHVRTVFVNFSTRHDALNTQRRFVMKVPDPILGPKGVRLLLAFRGFVG